MLNFFISFAVSFLGSIPLGSLNLTALQIYISNNVRSVAYFSFAAGLVEFFYSYFAIKGEMYLSENPLLNQIFSYISIAAFFFLAFINLSTKRKPISTESLHALNIVFESKDFRFFRKGLILSILNPQAIPFWLILSNFLEKQGLVEFYSSVDTLYYTSGVALGTFSCLLSFVFVIGKLLQKKEVRTERLNQIIGVLFLVFGIFQFGKIFY